MIHTCIKFTICQTSVAASVGVPVAAIASGLGRRYLAVVYTVTSNPVSPLMVL